ncbi:hypothetical protein ABZU76_07585 [Amycolatopsis sp. NPDC005232]|uniref:hypothetical protein n=1 Tax=Amycolatopsis sp. NPDC005232 TaxID=3157027 RepID=UPI0033A4132C
MRFRISRLSVAGAATLALFAGAASAAGSPNSNPKRTIVLVHGARADSSNRAPVIERLLGEVPLRASNVAIAGLQDGAR